MPKAGPINTDRLKSFIDRVEKLEEERQAITGDIRDVYSEAKGVGYDVKTMRKVIALRKMDAADRDEQEALLDTYMHALGMVDRVEARAAAGQSAREIAAAENISKSTAHRVSQKAKAKNASAETGHPAQDGQPSAAIAEGEGAGVIAAPSGLPETKPTRASNAASTLPVAREKEADFQAGDAGQLEPPSDPASQEVNAGPPPERESLSHLDGQGTHPGTYSESCGGVEGHAQPATRGTAHAVAESRSAPAAEGPQAGVESGPQDIDTESCGERAGALGASAVVSTCTLETPPLGPQDTADDGLDIPPFLRREKAEVMA